MGVEWNGGMSCLWGESWRLRDGESKHELHYVGLWSENAVTGPREEE